VILRSLVPLVLLASIDVAPIQCGHETDPALRQDESPGDALWDLAQKFDEAHDEPAMARTLQYLVERYPASRWSAAARARLDRSGAASADGGG
jgi:hypothetical protein